MLRFLRSLSSSLAAREETDVLDLRNQEPRFRCPLCPTGLRSGSHFRRLAEGRSRRKQATLPDKSARRVGLLRQVIVISQTEWLKALLIQIHNSPLWKPLFAFDGPGDLGCKLPNEVDANTDGNLSNHTLNTFRLPFRIAWLPCRRGDVSYERA